VTRLRTPAVPTLPIRTGKNADPEFDNRNLIGMHLVGQYLIGMYFTGVYLILKASALIAEITHIIIT
jgi:hypothetical protein